MTPQEFSVLLLQERPDIFFLIIHCLYAGMTPKEIATLCHNVFKKQHQATWELLESAIEATARYFETGLKAVDYIHTATEQIKASMQNEDTGKE